MPSATVIRAAMQEPAAPTTPCYHATNDAAARAAAAAVLPTCACHQCWWMKRPQRTGITRTEEARTEAGVATVTRMLQEGTIRAEAAASCHCAKAALPQSVKLLCNLRATRPQYCTGQRAAAHASARVLSPVHRLRPETSQRTHCAQSAPQGPQGHIKEMPPRPHSRRTGKTQKDCPLRPLARRPLYRPPADLSPCTAPCPAASPAPAAGRHRRAAATLVLHAHALTSCLPCRCLPCCCRDSLHSPSPAASPPAAAPAAASPEPCPCAPPAAGLQVGPRGGVPQLEVAQLLRRKLAACRCMWAPCVRTWWGKGTVQRRLLLKPQGEGNNLPRPPLYPN